MIENIRTFALPFENQTYTFAMQYKYDSWNRIQEMTYPDGERVRYGYNLGGMLCRVAGQKDGRSYRYIDSILRTITRRHARYAEHLTSPVPVEGSAQRFRVSRNDGLLCGGERGIWAAGSSVGLRDAVRAAHIPFPCRGDTRVIPPHTLSSVATAGHNRVAEPPTARATSPDDESPTGDLSRAPHRLRLQTCIPSRGWAVLLHIELRGAGIAEAVLYDQQGRVVETQNFASLQQR